MPILQVKLTSIKEMYFLGNGGAGIQPQGCGSSNLHSFSTDSAESDSSHRGHRAATSGSPTSLPPWLLD